MCFLRIKKTTNKKARVETTTADTNAWLTPLAMSPCAELNSNPPKEPANTAAKEFMKFNKAVPVDKVSGVKVAWAAGVIETALKLSAMPVTLNKTKKIIIEKEEEIMVKGNMAKATNPEASAIDFQEFPLCFPTQIPVNAGKIMVMMVRGIDNNPTVVALLRIIWKAAKEP